MNGKIIFLTKITRRFLLGILIAVCVILWIAISPSYADKRLNYKTYHPQTGEVFNRFYVLIEDIPAGGYKIHWVSEEGGFKIEEDYILNTDFETIWWRVIDVQQKTDYTGEKKGDQIFVRGQFRGDKVDKVIELDGRPFYYNPKFGLMKFVLSGKKSGKFLGFRHDELKEYPMKAINKGLEVITVDGQDVEAIRVHWTVDDFRSAFFRRVYWFRKSDGLYIKQKVNGGKFRELVSEQMI